MFKPPDPMYWCEVVTNAESILSGLPPGRSDRHPAVSYSNIRRREWEGVTAGSRIIFWECHNVSNSPNVNEAYSYGLARAVFDESENRWAVRFLTIDLYAARKVLYAYTRHYSDKRMQKGRIGVGSLMQILIWASNLCRPTQDDYDMLLIELKRGAEIF